MAEAILLTFGKYRNRPIGRVPRSYLRWLLDHADGATPEVRSLARQELARRGQVVPGYPISSDELTQVLERCFQELRARWDAGRGQDHAVRLALADAHDRLRRTLGLDG
jgi:hypothetical protein